SDFPIYGCEFPIFPGEKQTPKISVTVHGLTPSYLDIAHVLDTGGFDADCQLLNESRQWREVGVSGQTSGQLVLQPATATAAAGTMATVTAIALDGASDALPNVAVSFKVLSGPNAGKTGQATTDPTGAAVFTYGGAATGLDTLQATITNAAGGVVPSGTATVRWVPQVSLTLSPATAAHGVGTVADLTLRASDSSGQPVQGLAVTFRVASGPNAGRIGHGITDANGQAGFSLTSNAAGTDTLDAELILLGGGTQASNPATVTWSAPSTLTLAPPATTLPVGGQATLTAQLLDGTRHPVAGAPVTVNVLSGPNAGNSGQSTTDATGQALFSYTGTAQGTDILQATSGSQLSNLVTATWSAVPTTITYIGARVGEPGEPLQLSARLTDSLAGAPLAGQTLTFLLGTQTATATTGPDGVASATITPQAAPGAVPLTVTFAGNGPYTGSSAALLISLQRLPTVITFTGRTAIANGLAQPVSAKLADARTGQPLLGKTVTFTTGSLSASAITDSTGTAATTLTL
ncbi:MAG TPA: Ig-like domain-containing protein, partial [Thermoanaerobaculia bacterium]